MHNTECLNSSQRFFLRFSFCVRYLFIKQAPSRFCLRSLNFSQGCLKQCEKLNLKINCVYMYINVVFFFSKQLILILAHPHPSPQAFTLEIKLKNTVTTPLQRGLRREILTYSVPTRYDSKLGGPSITFFATNPGRSLKICPSNLLSCEPSVL